jgi:phospholipase/carboxylesterase
MTPVMKMARLANLDAYIAGGTDREGGGTGPVVVLMHGYGAPGDDLVTLQRVLAVPPEIRFVFPEAALTPPELAAFGGRAWWPIDMMAMQQAAAQGRARDRMNSVPAGLAEARAQLDALLDAVEREFAVSGEQIILGGFSQGSMLACDVVLRSSRPFAGLVLLSSTPLSVSEWQPLMAARKGLPVLQTHGTHDQILPQALAIEQRDMLSAAGLDVKWLSFPGGHELPSAVLEAVSAFIRARFALSAAGR